MTQQNNTRLVLLKTFLCLSGLFFGFSILTETAFLQNAPPKPSPTARRTATPRPKKTVAPPVNDSEEDVVREDVYTTTNTSVNSISVSVPAPPPANSTVRGRVFYADTGRAVKRAPIMLMRDKGLSGPGNTPTALTDGDGNFQMKNVPAGTYFAMINAPGVVSPLALADISKLRGSAAESEEFEKASEGFEKIVVDGISDAEVQIPARRGGAIGGRVMYDNGDAAIGVKVEILRKTKDKFLPVIPNFGAFFAAMMGSGAFQTDDRGVYRFAGLPAGEYIVKVTENISHTESNDRNRYGEFEMLFGGGGNSLLSIFYPDAFESKAANIINVELGQEITEINMTIPSRSLYTIEGKIVSRKDKTPVKARISIKREGEEDVTSIFSEIGRFDQKAQTDEKGNWKFKELPKGNYKLVIEPIQQGEVDYRDYVDYSNANVIANVQKSQSPPQPKLAKKIQPITLEDKDISEMVIELGAGATVSGTITVENNEKMPKSVSIVALSEDNEHSVSDNVSNHDGEELREMSSNSNVIRSNGNMIRSGRGADNNFLLENVIEGKTDFYVSVDDTNYYVKSAKADGVDLLAGKIEIKDGDNIKNVQIVLSKNTGTLKGKLVNENNEPLKNSEFTLVPTDAARRGSPTFFRLVKTNAAGEFEIKLAPMEYAVIFHDMESFPKKMSEIDQWYEKVVKDAQKVTVDAGETENVTVKKIKKQN